MGRSYTCVSSETMSKWHLNITRVVKSHMPDLIKIKPLTGGKPQGFEV